MTGRVVVGGGVAGDGGVAQREDVAVAIDCVVVGDVDPALVVLVVALMLRSRATMPRLSGSATAEWWIVIRVMVCGLPPGRAGRAPQDARGRMTPDVAVGAAVANDVPASGVAIAANAIAPVVSACRRDRCLG